MSARTFTSWRQNVLMGIYKVATAKGALFSQHAHVLNFNVANVTDEQIPDWRAYAAEL